MDNNVAYFAQQEAKVAQQYYNADGPLNNAGGPYMPHLNADEIKTLEVNIQAIRSGLSTIGTLGGLYVAYAGRKKLMGYIGLAILGTFVGYSVGYLASFPMLIKLEKNV